MSESAQTKLANHSAQRPARTLADRTFSHVVGGPLIGGNAARLLLDTRENYPVWPTAIKSAERTIHFENYMIYDDEVGFEFADALIVQAQKGVRVRVLHDWMGSHHGITAVVATFARRRR
jgi:cardiolipin synthase